jgi:hypothetical protein
MKYTSLRCIKAEDEKTRMDISQFSCDYIRKQTYPQKCFLTQTHSAGSVCGASVVSLITQCFKTFLLLTVKVMRDNKLKRNQFGVCFAFRKNPVRHKTEDCLSSCFNNWVMHPVALVSIKYWKTFVRNKVFFGARFYCALLTLHVSATFGGHLQVVHKHKKYPR